MTISSISSALESVGLGCWTILDDSSDDVRAIVTRERDTYTVRDRSGRILGRFPTAQLALASVVA